LVTNSSNRRELVESVHDPSDLEADRLFSLEQSLAHDLGNGTISGKIVVKPLAHSAEVLVTTRVCNAHAAMHRGGTQINEETIRLEHAPGFVKGMNHALMGHSSQHPSKDYKVEGLVRKIELFRFSDVIMNTFGEPAGQMPAG
jgi:hypothetical protein